MIILLIALNYFFKKFDIFEYDILRRKWLLALASALIFSGLSTDSYSFYIKGVVTVLLLYFSFQFFALLLSRGNKYSIIAFLLGYSLSNILVSFVFLQFSDLMIGERALSVEEYQEEMYAYIYFPLAYVLNALLFENHRGKLILVNIAFALIFLFGGSRNSYLILLLTDVFLVFNYFNANKLKNITNGTIVKFGLILVLCLGIASQGYSYLAANGYLGEGAQLKYEIQSSSKGGIASSRSYFLRGLITIAHHPLGAIGFQQVPDDNYEIRQEFAKLSGSEMRYEDPNCAAHSAMLDWWIYFGILTFPFWLFVLKRSIKACKMALLSNNVYTALALICCFRILWNALFSPFSDRIMWGFQIMVVLFYLHIIKNEQNGITGS